MGRKSSVLRQPLEVRDGINDRMDDGQTLDEVLTWLRENGVEDISRTALWRWGKQLDRIMAKNRRARMIAEVLTRRIKHSPENRLVQANVESMHGVLMQLIDAAEMNAEDGKVTLTTKEALELSRSIAFLAQAEKINVDRVVKIEDHTAKEEAPDQGGAPSGVIEIAFVEPKQAKAKKPRKSMAKKSAKTE